jgi:hypothetical protein
MKQQVLAVLTAVSCASNAQLRTRAATTVYTRQGIAIIDPKNVAYPLDDAVDDVMAWWCFRYPYKCDKIKSWAFRGIIQVEAGTEPLTDPWYIGKASGFTYGCNIRAWFDTRDNGSNFIPTVKHELGHVVLNWLLPGSDHHSVMQEMQYPWR